MCGRYTIFSTLEEMITAFMIADGDVRYEKYKPNFNVAPTHTIPVVINQDGKRVLDGFRWAWCHFGQRTLRSGLR